MMAFAGSVHSQEGHVPGDRLTAVFSPANKAKLCNSDNRVRSMVLIGELGKVYQINLFALPDVPSDLDDERLPKGLSLSGEKLYSYSDPVEERAVYWITSSNKISRDVAKQAGIGDEHELLDDIKSELIAYSFWLSQQDMGLYRLAPGTQLGHRTSMRNRDRLVSTMLDPPAHPGAEPTAAIVCSIDAPVGGAQTGVGATSASKADTGLAVAVRGSIDDLAIPRNGRSDAFKKTADAKVAYTDNGTRNEEAVATDVVFGVGWTVSTDDAILGFIRYNESSTETDLAGDDDDSKDIRAVSAGLLYRRPLQLGRLYAMSGVTAYETWDRAQESKLLRIRAFLGDIVGLFGKNTIVCGRDSRFGGMYYSCRVSAFAEKGRVLETGRSTDFADIADDDYAGLGTDISLSAWLPGIKPVSKLMLTAQYKKMWVFDGSLEDPDRFMVELSYKVPNSDVSVSLSRSYGNNFDTFQREEVNLLSIGFKY